MKKRVIKIFLLSFLVIGLININDMIGDKNTIERKLNPDLHVLKAGWQGNVCINGKFFNDTIIEKAPMWDVLKWKLSRNPQKEEKKKDTFQLNILPLERFFPKENSIIWLGHSSFIITINGVTLLTDPCFSDLPTSKRQVPLPCSIDSIKLIDYLLISHDHRDHFDKKSLEILVSNNPHIEALVPLNARRLFNTDKLKNTVVQEAGWYQEYKLGKDIRIIFLPAKHWGRRGLNDFNKTLWGSFLIISGSTKIFFAGDSAYESELFKEISNLFGEIDICLLPIAAYAPQFLMKKEHMNPEEAIQAFTDLGGKIFIPMHYGTYDLSDEPLGEPIEKLRKCAIQNSVNQKIEKLSIGGVFQIK